MKTVFFYVQHLLGVGHLRRSGLIADGLARAGFRVILVNGGMQAPAVAVRNKKNITLIQLPPICSDATFSGLFDAAKNPLTEAFRTARCQQLLELFEHSSADVLLLESYPFARRQLRFELQPLLCKAVAKKPRPLIASSIRDIIQPLQSSEKINQVISLIAEYFDYIFVHGDKNFIPFEHSFPAAKQFEQKLIYTGYVAGQHQVMNNNNEDAASRYDDYLLVSAGGGAVGEKLYHAAIDAANILRDRKLTWHILSGQTDLVRLENSQQRANHTYPSSVIIEKNRTDFRSLLAKSALSISQCGYNTMLDILVTATPSLVIPFEGVAEQEQLLRAQAFTDTGRISLLREGELSGQSLASAICKKNDARAKLPHVTMQLEGEKQLANQLMSKLVAN